MTERPPRLATRVVHGGGAPVTGEPVVTPLVQSVNFVEAIGSAEGLRYPRYGNVPNAEQVQRRLAALEGAEAALVLGSGMGALACAMLALLRPGDHLVASEWIYGGARRLLAEELPRLGIDVTLVDPTGARAWRRALRRETRGMFLETPSNPACRVIDLGPLRRLAGDEGIALVVDATFASPINLRPIEHGADVVLHSATKYLNGHNDVLGGVVLGTASYVEEVRQKMILWGQAPDPFACWLLERGLKTLDVRVQRQNANALAIATWLAEHPAVSRVHYAGLRDHPDHAVASRQMSGFGGMLAFELAGGGPAAARFLKRLRLIRNAPSLGGVDTIVSEPRYTSHAHLSPEGRAAAGIPDGFVRVSVGIEAVEDLIEDLAQAVER
ncbi:MAG: aminotransferase class I/II-fold pyridoxal phosphate-dependent enzyme [Gemmatimonadaceae bacterium]|nr:aminotransferase class I/II-fold pyridoxal phosphate-dependent enzyme [Gemmatimonadaceae bacterium]